MDVMDVMLADGALISGSSRGVEAVREPRRELDVEV